MTNEMYAGDAAEYERTTSQEAVIRERGMSPMMVDPTEPDKEVKIDNTIVPPTFEREKLHAEATRCAEQIADSNELQLLQDAERERMQRMRPDRNGQYDVSFSLNSCPRMPYLNERLDGKVCTSSTGRVGVVTGKHERYDSWVGMGVDGKGAWSSESPVIIADSLHEFYETCQARFNGALCYADDNKRAASDFGQRALLRTVIEAVRSELRQHVITATRSHD